MKKTFLQFVIGDVYNGLTKLNTISKQKGFFPIRQAVGRFKMMNALSALKEKMYTVVGSLQCVGYVSNEPLSFEHKENGTKVDLAVGKSFAKNVFDCAWLHVTGTLPEGYNAEDVVFLIDTAGEGLVFDRFGSVKQGITTFCSQFDYTLGMPEKKVVLTDGLTDGRNIDFYIDCGANDLFGNLKKSGELQQLDIAVPQKNVIALYYDLEALLSVFDNNKNDGYFAKLYEALRKSVVGIENMTDERAAESRKILAEFLTAKNDDENVFSYTAVGHAHLDLAWLWPIRESIRKGGRTFSNQLLNIRLFDGYIFGASQAQLYQWVKDAYPDVYEGVREAIRQGRWEVQGATWVEMDSNLTGAESLVRQFFYGKKFFREEFGLDMKILWLPDSFGYSACLPQLMAQADVPYFLTQKMSWNTVNQFPYHTFRWEGLDGTPVLAHMLPENTYNGPATGNKAVFGEKNYKERKIHREAVSLFGIGDGGAGPGFDHIERAARMADVKGLPRYRFGTAAEFFTKLSGEAIDFPTHRGELYLERHQGTYTTRVRNKQNNRRCERLLTNYEKLAAIASDRGMELPIGKEEWEKIWKEVLLYQFHDILPGSSINRVYEETDARYEIMTERLNEGIEILLKSLAPENGVVNMTSFAYSLPIKGKEGWYRAEVPACGTVSLDSQPKMTEFFAQASGETLENDKVIVRFEKGLIVSIFDKEQQKEMVPKGEKVNVFSQYTDMGDCWDIRPVQYQKCKKNAELTAFSVGTDGAKAFANVSYRIENTTVAQEISVLDGSPMITFRTTVDNHCSKKMLRVALPFAVSSEEASFNIQFGHLKRKTTEKNGIEKAQFEVSGQKFVDLSEETFGVSVLNDCKYGYRVKGHVIDMDILRTPRGGPGKQVDQGLHTFTYAIYPHKGKLGIDTYKQAYLLNNPLLQMDGTGTEEKYYSSDNEHIIVEAVKCPEDGNGVILRVYNASEEEQTATVCVPGYSAKEKVNIMEERIAACDEKITLPSFSFASVRFVKEGV